MEALKWQHQKLILGAQLIDTKSNTVFKSFDAEGPSTEINIIRIADSLSQKLINFLAISKLIKENPGYGSFYLFLPPILRKHLDILFTAIGLWVNLIYPMQ